MTGKNEVTMTCPYCDHTGDGMEISYAPFSAMANESPYKNEDGAGLKGEGKVDCEECGKEFLYKLKPVVVCTVAKMPVYV